MPMRAAQQPVVGATEQTLRARPSRTHKPVARAAGAADRGACASGHEPYDPADVKTTIAESSATG
jgi:hypothetical protein